MHNGWFFKVQAKPVVRRMARGFFFAGCVPVLLMILLCYLGITPGEAIRRMVPMCLFLWGIASFLVTYHQQVDEDGIWECALLLRRGWCWKRFTSQHIYQAGDDFFDAKAKWWQTDRCSLENLSEQQRTEVLEHIHLLWRPPPLAEQLQLHTFWGWHRSLELFGKFKFDNQWLKVTFSADGVVLDGSARDAVVELLPWSEVRSIDIVRHSSDSPVPGKLLVRFRNARAPIPFHLHVQQSDKQTLCQLEPCLVKWSLPGTVNSLSWHGPIKSVKEALFRKLYHRKEARELRNMLMAFTACMLFCVFIAIFSDEFNVFQKWCLMAVLGVVYFPFLVYTFFQYRRLRSYLQEVNAFLRQSVNVTT